MLETDDLTDAADAVYALIRDHIVYWSSKHHRRRGVQILNPSIANKTYVFDHYTDTMRVPSARLLQYWMKVGKCMDLDQAGYCNPSLPPHDRFPGMRVKELEKEARLFDEAR